MLRAGCKRRCLDDGGSLRRGTLPTVARDACLADARQYQHSAHNPNEGLKVRRFSGIAICLVALLLAILRGGELSAQMLDMVQPVRNQVLLNPALVGNSERMRADVFYRNQWLNANSPYNTFGLTYDLHFGAYDNHALGASVVNDVQGPFTLQHTSALAYYSYVVDISYNIRLRIGAGAGVAVRSTSYNSLVFPDQLAADPGTAVPNRYADRTDVAPDFAAGLQAEISEWQFGFAAHHIANPRFDERRGDHLRLQRRFTLTASRPINLFATYRHKPPLLITPHVLLNLQGRELFATAGCEVSYLGISGSLWLHESILFQGHNISAGIGWDGTFIGFAYTYNLGFYRQGFNGLGTSVHEVGLRLKIPYPRGRGFSTSTRSRHRLMRYSRKRTTVLQYRRKRR